MFVVLVLFILALISLGFGGYFFRKYRVDKNTGSLILVLIFIILFINFVIAGLKYTTPVNSARSNASQIPFAFFIYESENPQTSVTGQKALLANWDIKRGKVVIAERPLFRSETRGEYFFKMAWDGGRRILLNVLPYPGATVDIKDPRADYSIKKLNPLLDGASVIQTDSDSSEFMAAYYKLPGERSKQLRGDLLVETRQGIETTKRSLSATLPAPGATEPVPLLLYGTPDNFTILVTYNDPRFSGDAAARLMAGQVRGSDVQWKEVKGDYNSFIAGAGSGIAKAGNLIYVSNPVGSVQVLDMLKSPLRLEKYNPASSLLDGVKGKFSDFPVEPVFGVYNDVLLITVQTDNEKWLWALKNHRCVGSLYFNVKEEKLTVYKDDNVSESLNLPGTLAPINLQLPKAGYGAWK